MNVLVDTSVWSLALRRASRDLNSSEKAIVAELAELIKEARARIIGLIRQELLSGLKNPDQFKKVREILRAFPDEPVDTADYEAAALAGNECRSRGVSVSLADLLICAIAASRGWSIYSADADFKRYAKILPIALHSTRR